MQTRCHDHARQFVRSPSPRTESHFPGQSFGGLLSTTYASSRIGPLFTSMSILTGQRQTTCRDDGSGTTPTVIVPGHLVQGLFNLFETNVRLMTGQYWGFCPVPRGGGWTWTTERLNESSISNCSLEFNIYSDCPITFEHVTRFAAIPERSSETHSRHYGVDRRLTRCRTDPCRGPFAGRGLVRRLDVDRE